MDSDVTAIQEIFLVDYFMLGMGEVSASQSLLCVQITPRNLVKMQIPMWWVWGGA